VYKGAGLSVKLGLEEVATDLFRVKPYVYSSPNNSAVIVFSGHLTNLSELLRRNGKGGGPASPSCSSDYNNASSSLERKSSIERSLDLGAATASLVLNMYMDGQPGGNEIIMLSELQGEFAFVIYDNKRKQAFAARDPSGDEPLFYHITEDGDISFAGSRLAVPDGEKPHEWRELPPGHYISGKNPKLHQFALTPHQLAMREMQQEDELVSSFRPARYGVRPAALLSALGPEEEEQLAAQLSHRTSLDNDNLIHKKSTGLDGDVFSLDL
jgi:glutamine phosphoribosylpyrophosphate amidotransferase